MDGYPAVRTAIAKIVAEEKAFKKSARSTSSLTRPVTGRYCYYYYYYYYYYYHVLNDAGHGNAEADDVNADDPDDTMTLMICPPRTNFSQLPSAVISTTVDRL
jgi:hypothetical protein